MAPLLYLARGPARGVLAVLGVLGITCAFGGLLGIRLALDAGQPLWEPLGMIWGGGAIGSLCLGLRAHIPRMWNDYD